jgi:hypothetical protein
MRALYLAVALAAILVSSASIAKAASCPDARKEGFKMWPAGNLEPGQTLTTWHSCGKTLSCLGGKRSVKGSRTCHWQ